MLGKKDKKEEQIIIAQDNTKKTLKTVAKNVAKSTATKAWQKTNMAMAQAMVDGIIEDAGIQAQTKKRHRRTAKEMANSAWHNTNLMTTMAMVDGILQMAEPEQLTPEDEKYVEDITNTYLDKKAKKAIKRTAKRTISKSEKIKGLCAGAIAGAGAWVAFNFGMRKLIEMDMDRTLQTKQGVQDFVYRQIAEQYPTYIDDGSVSTNDIVNLAENLYAEGKEEEAELILEVLNGLESGKFQVSDINTFLTNNNLPTVASNMTPSQADTENALYEAYEAVHGFNPSGMTDQQVIQAIIDEHMRPLGEPGDDADDLFWQFESLSAEKRAELNKVHEDYMVLLNKTNNTHNINARDITEADLDNLLINRWDVNPSGSFMDKLEIVVDGFESELAGYAGTHDMQLLLSIQFNLDQGGTMDYATYQQYLDYRLLLENKKQNLDTATPQDILDILGYDGQLLTEYKQLGTEDYLFARIMEDKFSGLECVKSNGTIDFNNTAGLNSQQLAEYQGYLNDYSSWKQGATTTDTLEGVQNLGFLSESYQNGYVNEMADTITSSSMMKLASGAAVVATGAAVVLGYRAFKKHQHNKFIQTWDEEMTKRGLTEDDFVKHHYSFAEVDADSENVLSK